MRRGHAALFTIILLAGFIWTGARSVASPEVVETSLVSVATDGTPCDNDCHWPAISLDGRFVAFDSFSTGLVPDDANGASDVFLHEIATGTTTRVSVASDGTEGDGNSHLPALSSDGNVVVFESQAENLVDGDTNGWTDVFLHDVAKMSTRRVSMGLHGAEPDGDSIMPALSGDGLIVVYQSFASNLVVGDTNRLSDVFLYDVATGTTKRISIAPDGTEGDGNSWEAAVAADGSAVVYTSHATNLVPGDTNDLADVFRYDVATGTTTRVSVGSDGEQSNGTSWAESVSGDGGLITFGSEADNLVVDDTNGVADAFLHDLNTGSTRRISLTADGSQPNDSSFGSAISADGRFVAFYSFASNILGSVHWADVFVHKLATGATIRVSVASDGVTLNNDFSYGPAISGDGSAIVYTSIADNLVPDDTNGVADVFLALLEYDPFDDDDGSIFEDDIEWLATEGITSGCGPRLYCPSEPVTRGQMAAFLTRALDLPTTTTDYFTDDTHSIFHGDINALAHAGITTGCTPTTYCPTDPVTRGQMAAFLRRALE